MEQHILQNLKEQDQDEGEKETEDDQQKEQIFDNEQCQQQQQDIAQQKDTQTSIIIHTNQKNLPDKHQNIRPKLTRFNKNGIFRRVLYDAQSFNKCKTEYSHLQQQQNTDDNSVTNDKSSSPLKTEHSLSFKTSKDTKPTSQHISKSSYLSFSFEQSIIQHKKIPPLQLEKVKQQYLLVKKDKLITKSMTVYRYQIIIINFLLLFFELGLPFTLNNIPQIRLVIKQNWIVFLCSSISLFIICTALVIVFVYCNAKFYIWIGVIFLAGASNGMMMVNIVNLLQQNEINSMIVTMGMIAFIVFVLIFLRCSNRLLAKHIIYLLFLSIIGSEFATFYMYDKFYPVQFWIYCNFFPISILMIRQIDFASRSNEKEYYSCISAGLCTAHFKKI